ncbi:MAG: T9SS type A sorting domain-containing protein [Crocinitomicaceae bacterium]|nr:T9SS type A sorting domain-containing protein [Crocinitomicaceae bacterium]
MSYNLLNFPTGNIPGRVDTLKKIVDYVRPSLLMIQELRTEDGLIAATDMIDNLGYGSFACSQFVPQGTSMGEYNLQQAIIFDQRVFRLKSQHEIVTELRDVNEFVLYVNDNQLETGGDTTFFHVFVTHLKSSTGAANRNMRLSSVSSWLEYVEENLSPNDRVIIAGDFNLYNNSEPAYQAMVNPANMIPMKDIYSSYGDWSSTTFNHKEIYTQSTRASQLFNDGAGGGVDDRFDFILFSENLIDSDQPLYYKPGSYRSLGNTGQCYDGSITDCANGNPVPANILRSIYYQSDHIPQICDLHTSLTLNTTELAGEHRPEILLPRGNIATSLLTVSLLPRSNSQHSLQVMDMTGKIIYQQALTIPATGARQDINVETWPSGTYFLRASNEYGNFSVIRFVVVHQ